MNPEEIKQKTMTMRSGMVRMLRDREYWTAEDIETLKNEYYAGTSEYSGLREHPVRVVRATRSVLREPPFPVVRATRIIELRTVVFCTNLL